MIQEPTPGTLKPGEPHPAAWSCLEEFKKMPAHELGLWQETFSSLAIAGNRLAEVCSETLRRLQHGEPVSDRYLMGLYITIKKGETKHEQVLPH